MGNFNWRSPLGAGFAALAMALPLVTTPTQAAVSPTFNAPQSSEPLGFLRSLLNHHRGFVLGDLHTDLALPLWMADNMPAFKAMGVSTVYVEVPTDRQPLLDAMAKGNTEAKQRLVEYFLEKSPGMAQSRVEMIAAAQQAGLRVIGLDVAYAKVTEIAKTDANYIAKRLLWADPAIAENFKAADDGQKFIMFIGAAHSYPAAVAEAALQHSKGINNARGCLDPDNFFETANVTSKGGIDTRLGIPSIDSGNCPSEYYSGAAQIRKSTGLANDFIIKLPTHPLQGIGYPAADFSNWRAILAQDTASLYRVIYSGTSAAIPAAEVALSILDFRANLQPNLSTLLLTERAQTVFDRLGELEKTDGISSLHLGVLHRHIAAMQEVATSLLPQGVVQLRLNTHADTPAAQLGMGTGARPPSEVQIEITRQRIKAQLDEMQQQRRAEAPKLLN